MHDTAILTARQLDRLIEDSERLHGVRRRDLRAGDWILVTTKNSTYMICALGDDRYSVSGGWFDREGIAPHTTTINGCTWGGSAINTEVLASPGLFLEFGNQVLTTRIQRVELLPARQA